MGIHVHTHAYTPNPIRTEATAKLVGVVRILFDLSELLYIEHVMVSKSRHISGHAARVVTHVKHCLELTNDAVE